MIVAFTDDSYYTLIHILHPSEFYLSCLWNHLTQSDIMKNHVLLKLVLKDVCKINSKNIALGNKEYTSDYKMRVSVLLRLFK